MQRLGHRYSVGVTKIVISSLDPNRDDLIEVQSPLPVTVMCLLRNDIWIAFEFSNWLWVWKVSPQVNGTCCSGIVPFCIYCIFKMSEWSLGGGTEQFSDFTFCIKFVTVECTSHHFIFIRQFQLSQHSFNFPSILLGSINLKNLNRFPSRIFSFAKTDTLKFALLAVPKVCLL